jgi:hypothetical protein
MISTGIALAKAAIRSISAPRLARRHHVEQAVDALDQALLHRGDVARRQRPGDQPAHARVQRRVVEDEARRVVLEQRRRAVLREELLVLVRAEGRRVLVDGDDVGVAAEEDAAVRQALDRRVLAQRAVGRVRVVVEAVGQTLQVERFGEVAGVGHAASLRSGEWRDAGCERVRTASAGGPRCAGPLRRWRGRGDATGTDRGTMASVHREIVIARPRPRSGTRSPTSARCTRGWPRLRHRLPPRARRARRHLRQRHGRARADRRRRPERRRVAWSVVGGRLSHHNASAQVFAEGSGATRFVWIADFLPDEHAAAIATMIEHGMTAIKRHLDIA